ncbi:MAG: hypothetical protein IJW82_07935 [Clostridia bacterium]|nr:hypothetical protein [Clostridia bacterium]
MKTIYYLTMMQLKDRLDLSKKTFLATLLKSVIDVLKFVGITALVFLGFYLLKAFRLVSLDGSIPNEVLVIVLTLMFLLSIITCTIKVMDSLYFSKDNTFLLTMPATKVQLFISKMLVFFLYELVKNIYFLLPVFIAFGVINLYPIVYYLWLIPCLILFTMLIVAIGGLLSIPSMLISMLTKTYFWLKTILVTVLLGAVILLIVKLISILPSSFNLVEIWATAYWDIQNFLKAYSQKFLIITMLAEFVVGQKVGKVLTLFTPNTLFYFLGILGAFVVIMAVSILLIKPLFFKMASMPFEYRKGLSQKEKPNIKLPAFMSFLKKEIMLITRTPKYINNIILMAISTPLSIFLMNKIYVAMNVSVKGGYMIVAFNVLMITLMVTSSNIPLASVLSEEGAAFYLNKINPNKYSKSLITKLIFNVFVMTVSIIVSTIILSRFRNLGVGQGVMVFFIIEAIYIAHAFWSAELDIMNPQYEHYQKSGYMQNNPNEIKSNLLSFALSSVLALFTYVNLIENALNFYKAWTKILVIVLLFLAFRIYMYLTQIKLYYKEK